MNENKVVVAEMKPRVRCEWHGEAPKNKRYQKKRNDKRLLRNTAIFAAAFLCLCGGAAAALYHPEQTQAVMSHLTAGFEYDETLGRLQFVSNILPKSAMVFLTTDVQTQELAAPSDAEIAHAWSQTEPWLEYDCTGDVLSCKDGEVMTVVKNRQDEYTVRVLHDDGYESIYSGLDTVSAAESDRVLAGQPIGTAAGFAAFELRKDGLSVLPVFGSMAE